MKPSITKTFGCRLELEAGITRDLGFQRSRNLPLTRSAIVLALFSLYATRPASAEVRCKSADLTKLTKAIYVSPAGNDDASCGGSISLPCKTIAQGIQKCSGEGCGVLVRYGVYNTGNPVKLVEGVNLYGSCLFDETDYQYRSTIIGNPAVQASGIKKTTSVEGFVILGADAVHSGEASVALAVSDSSGLKLRQDVLASGRGASGSNGTTPYAGSGGYGQYASNKTTGGGGGIGCSSNPPTGSTGRGGKGADQQQLHTSWPGIKASCTNNNYPASLGKDGEGSGSINGGAGGVRGSAGCACSGGGDNAGKGGDAGNGNTGASSTQGGSRNAVTKGNFAGIIWRPGGAGSGTAGQVGSGGGGGGSGGYGALRGDDYSGFPGGGGGGGGCGGPGGSGAQQGGASIPIVLFGSSISGLADANAIVPGPGGRGGTGGKGASGGLGGSGSSGYLGQQYNVQQGVNGIVCKGTVPGQGGKGGTGGRGGPGSGGAGGSGGPSFGIALVSSPALLPNGIAFYAGQPGAGGDLGPRGENDAQSKGMDGNAGLAGFGADPIVVYSSTSLATGTHP